MSQFQSAPDPAGNANRSTATEREHPRNERLRHATERARHVAHDKSVALKREAQAKADASRTEIAGRAFTIASAIRATGRELEAQGEPLGSYAEMAGDKIAELSRYLEDHSSTEIMGEVESLARRQPWFFVGGAFALGLMAGRFIKAGSTVGGHEDFDTVEPAGFDTPREDYALTTESDYALATGGMIPKGGGDGHDV